jgi:Flp pilus assembly pilin Flp
MRRSPVYAPRTMSVADAEGPSSRLTELRVSARGWHGIQLAVIGFIGFCGVLQDGRPDNPTWLQVWAAILVLVALVLACVGTFLVGRVAWPLVAGPRSADAGFEREAQRLRRGLLLTFVAVAVLALGTASGWWPQSAGDGGGAELVAVQASSGERACGSLVQASPGTLRVSVDGRTVDVVLRDVASVDPVESC